MTDRATSDDRSSQCTSKRVEDLIAGVLGYARAEVRPASRIHEDLGLDSFDLVELLEEIESRLGIHLSDRLLESATTVGDIVAAALRALSPARRVEPPRDAPVGRAS